MNERLEAVVQGRVQMVMFRDFVERKASRLKLSGEVQNRTDGTVWVVAEGSRAALEALLQKLHKGPVLSQVEKVESSWKPATGAYSSFKINYGK
jgi:acylphosphatase